MHGNNSYTDDLFEIDRYLERSHKYRLAFREFGTCMGIKCMSEQSSEKESAVDLKVYAEKILDSWNVYMQMSLATKATPDDLRPITRVMYASALRGLQPFRAGTWDQSPSPTQSMSRKETT